MMDGNTVVNLITNAELLILANTILRIAVLILRVAIFSYNSNPNYY